MEGEVDREEEDPILEACCCSPPLAALGGLRADDVGRRHRPLLQAPDNRRLSCLLEIMRVASVEEGDAGKLFSILRQHCGATSLICRRSLLSGEIAITNFGRHFAKMERNICLGGYIKRASAFKREPLHARHHGQHSHVTSQTDQQNTARELHLSSAFTHSVPHRVLPHMRGVIDGHGHEDAQ